MALPRKPMTALYEAVRRFLEHPQDDTGRAELEYHLGLYEAEAPSGGGAGWRPHPLNLHPPPTPESQAAFQRMVQGEQDLCGARIKVDPTRVQQAVEVVTRLSADLQLDHVYCLYLLRAVSHEDLRVWIEGKVQPASAFFDEYSTAAAQAQAQAQLQAMQQLGGGQMMAMPQQGHHGQGMMGAPRALRDDVEAAARYLFFIEKRNALNALLELVQARMGVGLSEAKQHAVTTATDALISQGLPGVLLRRVEWVTREARCRGRTPLEVEFEVERQKAADCLFFLFYQTQILPRELLPLSNSQQQPATTSNATALVPAAAGGSTAGGGNGPLTLLGLVKSLTEELRRKFGASAPGEEQSKSREERALYRALTTLLMTLVTALTTTDGLLPRPGSPGGAQAQAGQGQQPQRNALLGYILEEGGVNAAIGARQAYEREHKAAHAQQQAQGQPPAAGGGGLTGEAERRVKEKEAAHRDAVGRVKEFLQRLRGEVEGGWANAGVQAVVLLAWGALLREEGLGERLAYAGLERWHAEARRDLLARAVGQGVFAFVEGALVHCWRRPQQEQDAHMFFLDVTVELLSVYLRAPGEIVRSLPGYGRRPGGADVHMGMGMGMGMGMAPHHMHPGAQAAAQAAADASGQRKAAVEALISLVVRLSEAHPALAERLLWTRGGGNGNGGAGGGGEDEPVQFVRDVSELVKHDAALRAGWIQLLAAMAAAPSEECKLSTVDFLTDYSPFADARRRPLDVLTYVLEDTRSRAEQNQPLQRDYLMGALAVITRVACPALARDRELGFVPHILPHLLALLNYPLPMEPKGALLKALAAFAALPDGLARQLWESLEAMRILPGRGRRELLRRELEEVETRQASYPITEGFVMLLAALLRGDVPHDLGEATGTRAEAGETPGVQPYIDYLVEDVLLPIRARPHADGGQRWKIAAKALEALVLVLERYPLVADDDRLRNLGLDSVQRRQAKEQVYRDIDHQGPPSPGFRLLLRLLASPTAAAAGPGGEGQLLGLLLDIVAAYEPSSAAGARASLLAGANGGGGRDGGGGQQVYHHLLHDAGESLPLGPWRLEHKARLREARAWDEAVRAFDAEEPAHAGRLGPRWEQPEDEARWQEACVRLSLELLNNAAMRDGEFRRLYAELPDHPYFRGFRVSPLHDLVYRGGAPAGAPGAAGPGAGGGGMGAGSVAAQKHRRALAQGRLLPLIAEYGAYEQSPALRLQAALLFRELVARFPQPQALLDAFRPAAQQHHDHFHYDAGGPGGAGGRDGAAARAVDAVVRTLSHAGEPVELEGSALLELGSLQSSLNLLTKLRRAAAAALPAAEAAAAAAGAGGEPAGPTAGQVDRLAHFLLLDTLLHAFLPQRATLAHLLLGYRLEEVAVGSALSLPADPAGSVFGLHLLVRNLNSPAFLAAAPLLAERACELVYRLVAAGKTAAATLAYLQRDDVDFFSKELALLTRRAFPAPPRPPTSSSAAGTAGMGSPEGGRRGSLNAAQQHQHQQQLRAYFRAQVGYASALHVWAWLLKATAVALTHPQGDPSKARRLLDALIAAPPPPPPGSKRASAGQGSASPGPAAEAQQDFETRGMTLTELLLRLQLAHQREAPQPPNEELRALAERCAAPMGEPPESRAFCGIVHDTFLNQVRARLGAAGGGAGQQSAAAPGGGGAGAGDVMGSPLHRAGVNGGAAAGNVGAGTPGAPVVMGGAAPGAAARVLQEAAQYALRYNHFLLRQAGEYHFCAAWRRLAEAVLIEAENVLVAGARPGRGLGVGGQEDLKVVLPLVAQAAAKLARTPFGDGLALEEVAAVVLAGCGVVHRYARSRPAGIPEAALSVDEGQRVLELLLAALLRVAGGGGGGDATQPAQRKYRMQLYAALILYLRATTLAPLPEPAGDGALLLLTGGGDGGGGGGGGGGDGWRSGSGLLGLRRENNAEALARPRFLLPLVDALVADAAYSPSLGSRARARHQGLAAAALGLVLEALLTAGAPEGPLLPLGVVPGVGRYDAAVREALGRLTRLLDDLEPQFCVERPSVSSSAAAAVGGLGLGLVGAQMTPPPPALAPARLLEERPGDLALGYYLSLLIQVAQDPRGAKALLDRGVVEKLGRARFLVALEDGDAPAPAARDRERLLAGVGGVLRLLDVMLARLPLNGDLRTQADAFLRAHARTLAQFVEGRQGDLEGLEEVGAAVALLAHNVGAKGSGVLGRAAPPPSLAPAQDEYRRLVNAMFERFAVELLPPLAVRFQVRTQGWWAEVEEPPEAAGLPCEPPPGVSPTYAWRVGDALKLLVSQTLLLHVTTYIRRRLRKARYPNLRVETVLVSLRMALTFLAAQGEGPAPPVPAYTDVRRAAQLLQLQPPLPGLQGAAALQLKAPWDYAYLRTSLRRLFESLLDILYHLVADRAELDPDFPKARVHAELLKALQGHDAWLERQMQMGAWPHLRMVLDSIQDRLRV